MTDIDFEQWEPVIGLEIHAQLATKTKLFSAAPNRFGDEPNTNITVVDTGHPGVLPVLNAIALEKAIQFGLAVGAEVQKFSAFDRKSYFYPDSPRNFQITQFYYPILFGGVVICEVNGETREFTIERAHLEDDAGMLKHFSQFAGVDYNRAGVPLIEIVSTPTMHTPKDASAYAQSIKAILEYLGVSNCNMEEGSMRMDANISVRPRGDKTLRPKVEIKNMNSFYNMEQALEAEILRQVRAYSQNPDGDFEATIAAGTYKFDPVSKKTSIMRRKESAIDYRYFPEPDLPPLLIKEEQIEAIRKTLPELPHERFTRYVSDLQLPPTLAAQIVADKYTADFYEEALKTAKNAAALCNWILVEFTGRLNEMGTTLQKSGLKSAFVGNLVKMIEEKEITGRIAKEVADEMVKHPEKDCKEIVAKNPNFQPLEDDSIVEPIVERVVKENPQSIVDFKAGRTKALAYLVGQVMKETKGKASPDLVNKLIRKHLDY